MNNETEDVRPGVYDPALYVQSVAMLNCRTLRELDVFASKLHRDVQNNPGEYSPVCLDILRGLYTSFRQYMHTGGLSDA